MRAIWIIAAFLMLFVFFPLGVIMLILALIVPSEYDS